MVESRCPLRIDFTQAHASRTRRRFHLRKPSDSEYFVEVARAGANTRKNRREDEYGIAMFRSGDERLIGQLDGFLTGTRIGAPEGIASDESRVVEGAFARLMTCIKTARAARAMMEVRACRSRSRADMHRAVCVFTFMIRASIMPSLFAHASSLQIVMPPGEPTPHVPPAASHRNRPVDTDGDSLLSPHEIAILMVLASEPRRQQGDPADLHCLADRGLVRLDAAPLADAHVRLSDRGLQMVSRLAERDRPRLGRHADFTMAGRTASETPRRAPR